ncbi:MAG: hypothetical protein KGH75_07910, partial [Rhodospirillales bacterium]|nr:hypothetical protein [Rhodospirillales bacterium]
GPWTVAGIASGFVATASNISPDLAGRASNTVLSNGSVVMRIAKTQGLLQFVFQGGQFQTPTMGITSDYGAFNSLSSYGSQFNPHSPSEISYWAAIQPSQYWSLWLGEVPSVEGMEWGLNFLNPTVFDSDLNNLQLASGYGAQLNLFYGPATLNIQYSDAYTTNRFNILSMALTYNLNADGSDYVIAYGHTNTGNTGNPGQPHTGVGLGFSEANGNLAGAGLQIISGPWSILPEAQFQWLPRSSVSTHSASPRPLTTYYVASAMTDVTYEINKVWSVTGQAMYAYQNNDKNDPNAGLFGNWLQYDAPAGPGTFSPGTGLFGLQANVTWQHQNLFIRPTLAYTHLNGFAHGTGYGLQGNSSNQVVALAEFGYVLGQY